MGDSASPRLDKEAFGRSVDSVVRLIRASELDDRFRSLHAELSRLLPFDNLIVYAFSGTSAPRLLGSNLHEKRLQAQMEDFVHGLFLLDPFVIEAQKGRTGVLRLRDIMPDDFLDSEFYRHHYTYTDVRDEVRFVVPVDRQSIVHVFVEREMKALLFTDREVGLLKAYGPAVELYVQQRMRWLDSLTRESLHARVTLDIGACIRSMGSLTSRECEVVELILRGHATKSIGRALEIEDGTVTNHKRNIYAKLDIHSQAQLFELFLRSIASI